MSNLSLSSASSNSFKIETSNREHNALTKDKESKWNGSFSFVQAADTQFGLIDRYILKKQDDLTGDLIDAYPYANLASLRDEQIRDLKVTLMQLNPEIKLVCVCGNHDIGDTPTESTIQMYKNEFGEDYFKFWTSGCKFICLNSQLYFDASLASKQAEEQDKWLDKELEIDSNSGIKHLVIFQHIPLFVREENEPAHVYFNIEPVKRKSLIERFKRAGVRKVFCGHYHQNAGGFTQDKQLEVIVTTAVGAQLGNDKHGYRLVNVDENEITHSYISVTDQVN